jgi:hypothetical protein
MIKSIKKETQQGTMYHIKTAEQFILLVRLQQYVSTTCSTAR